MLLRERSSSSEQKEMNLFRFFAICGYEQCDFGFAKNIAAETHDACARPAPFGAGTRHSAGGAAAGSARARISCRFAKQNQVWKTYPRATAQQLHKSS